MRYVQRWNDKPFAVQSDEITRWACCDCGLVHDIAFVARGKTIGVAASVNKRATAARRRKPQKLTPAALPSLSAGSGSPDGALASTSRPGKGEDQTRAWDHAPNASGEGS